MGRFLSRLAGTGAAMAVAALALAPISTDARGSGLVSASCTARFSNGVLHLCGPATATFLGSSYKNGTCKVGKKALGAALVLELGALKPGDRTNGGLLYLKIQIDGTLSNPTSGHVIAFSKTRSPSGKVNVTRWAGFGESFTPESRLGTLVGGTFEVKGGYGNNPPAYGGQSKSGKFRCVK